MQKSVRRGGFTLPEILVTVTVVAVLAAVVVPAVTQYVNKGNTPATQQDMAQLQNSITAFVADIRKYPDALLELTHNITTKGTDSTGSDVTGTAFFTSDSTAWKGPYLAATVSAANGFTSRGLGLNVGNTITKTGGWLQVAVVSPSACVPLLALDSALDKADGSANGSVVWTGTCSAGTSNGTITSASLRIVPAP